MPARRLGAFALLILANLLLLDGPTAGQGNPKAAPKPKPGAPLVADPNDLPKPGEPLSIRTPVQRPGPLKGVRSWTIETKRHRWYPTIIAVSPNGKHLATGGYDGIIRLWDADTGAFERALVGHDSYVYGLAWSPDGNYLASAGSFNATARVWEAKSGLCVRALKGHKGYVSHVAWSPDGARLLTAGGTSGFITLWDVANAKQLETTEYGNPIHSIAFAKDGEHVAASAAKAGTYIADARTLKTVHALKEALDDATAVAFSPDSKSLAAGSSKQTVVYDVTTGKLTRKLDTPGHAVAWTPAGGLLVAPADAPIVPHAPDGLAPGKAVPLVAGALGLSTDGLHLFVLGSGQVAHWHMGRNEVVRTTSIGESLQMLWAPNRPIVAGLGTSNSPSLWEAATGKPAGTLDGHTATVTAAAWAANGKALVTASADKTARVWEIPGGKAGRTLAGHDGPVTAVAVAPDGKIATGAADKKVRVWPATGDQPAHTLAGHRAAISAVAWAHDNRTLATGANERDVILWSADTGKQLRTLDNPSEVRALAFSPNGAKLAVGSADDRLRVFQVSTGKQLAEWEKAGDPKTVAAVAWAADGNFVLGGRGNHTLQYWSVKANKDVLDLPTMAPVTSVVVLADGKTLVGASLDRAVRFWDAGTGKLKLTLIADTGQILAVGADGNYRCPNEAESELVAVVQTDKGQETLSLKEFAAKYGFRNAPGAVK
jgi:WD40 repeat protein